MDSLEQLIGEFDSLSDWEGRYKFLIQKGRALSPYPEEFRRDDFKVKGCQSQVWLYPEIVDGKIIFYGDSDASIVKGLMAVLFEAYNNRPPEEILSIRPDFIERMGLNQHLSMSRAGGLASMIKQIGFYALAISRKIGG